MSATHRARSRRRPGAWLGLAVLLGLGACAMRAPSIGDVTTNPGRYHDRSVVVEGVVSTAWGVPLVPYKFYRLQDATGEITVISKDGDWTPTKGSRVRVKGKLREGLVLGGRSIGLHLEEQDLDAVRR